jgi:hypothetical protein
MKNAYKILYETPKWKRRLGRPRRKLEDNIKLDLEEIGVRIWIGLTWIRLESNSRLF